MFWGELFASGVALRRLTRISAFAELNDPILHTI